jgi:hypothetical protein
MRRLFVAALLLAACNGGREQPVPFNHALHAGTNKTPCETCHEHAADRAHAGLPRLEVCMDCHKRITPKSAAGAAHVERMRALFKDGADLMWVRVYEVPAHVYFSHQRHTEIGGLECKACHGDMLLLSAPPQQPIAATVSMDNCIACHESRGVTTDCAACHR